MVRIEDVQRAIEARGYGADGTFDLVMTSGDPASSAAEEMAVSVRVEGGRATVSAPNRDAREAIRTSRSGLASILYGGLRVGDAVRLGLADADPRISARAEAVLALAPPAPIDRF